MSLGLACFGIGRSLPFPDVPVVRPKMDWLARHGDEFDVLVIGSSRVQHQFMPSIFDQAAAESGHPVRSGNAGIAAMFPPEDGYVIDQILQRPHRRLRWAFIELTSFGERFDMLLAGTGRMDYWHDSRRMWLCTRRTVMGFQGADWQYAGSVWKRGDLLMQWLADWSNNFAAFIRRATNFGRGAELMTAHLNGGRKRSKFEGGGSKGDGWVNPGGAQAMNDRQLTEYQRDFAALRAISRRHVEDPVAEASLRRSIEQLRAEGIEPILFLAPAVGRTQFWPTRLLESVALVDLSEPEKYPELYDPANRKDGTHLNLAGSALYTRELALWFSEHTRGLPSR
ncbi:MAG: hypothetical protein ABJF10_17880 [Chthoniobacter sp.]|uniref:hypothetical protein n=1 Tax=Chthoniobacter sp. TaxID=2510640 RepID=UPI0032A39ADB